jgi:hypothetical protein
MTIDTPDFTAKMVWQGNIRKVKIMTIFEHGRYYYTVYPLNEDGSVKFDSFHLQKDQNGFASLFALRAALEKDFWDIE